MMLNDVQHFSMTMTQMIQLILGTNGSGKTSLMEELTPLPADPDAYYKGGSKSIEISHNGSLYRSESLFTGGAKHYLWKDGLLLNDGGTAVSMREVCRQEFGITPEFQKLITGKEKFTTMSPSRKREWLTILSDSNYDYAIGLFNRLKERSRDTTGALKRAMQDLVQEKNKLMSEAEEKNLRFETDKLHQELNMLMENRAPIDKSANDYGHMAMEYLRELNEASNRLFKLKLISPAGRHPLKPMERNEWGEQERPHFNSVDEVVEVIDYLNKNISGTEALLNKAVSDHHKHEAAVKMMERTGAEDIKALLHNLEEARTRKSQLLSRRKLKLEGINGTLAYSSLESVHEQLKDIFTSIPINEDRRYSSANEEVFNNKLMTLRAERDALDKDVNKKLVAKQHMESHKDSGKLTCPKCSHVWHQGYDPEVYAKLNQAIDVLGVSIGIVNKAIESAQESLEENRVYGNYYRTFVRLTSAWGDLKPFWDYLIENEYVVKNPRFALSVLETFRYDLELDIKAEKVAAEIIEIVKYIKAAEETGNTSIEEAQKHLDETQANIDEYTAILVDLRSRHGVYVAYRRDLTEAIRLGEQIDLLRHRAEKATHDQVEMMRRESIALCIRQLQSAVGRKEDVLSHISLQRGIIEQLEYKMIELQQEEEILKIMVREISPTDGIIAEGLMGFIRVFVNKMNSLIKHIWTYPLVIYPCGQGGMNGAELDYKFPLMVQNKDGMRKDIAEGSTGHREIIDLAFKVCAMEHLGLAEYPLFLDEFGTGLDEVHRVQSMQAIKNLMEQKPFTQLFMVSHYEASYGSLTQAEICVLCAANITIPPSMSYNKHVVIA